ncbi:MAG: hypothetical protein ABIC36_00695 [bacterium]
MSKNIKRSISVLTSITTTVWLSGAAMLVPMAAGAAVIDGDLIRNPNAEGMAQLDIYIVKLVGDKKFKRLILSPHVFESYEHFDKNGNGNNWDDVMDVSQAVMDEYTTSDLVRTDGDTKVYRLNAADGADDGDKYWLDMTAEEFAVVFDSDAIYTINGTDVGGYTTGANVTDPSAVFPPALGGETGISQGTLTVSLAADTPASAIVVGNAARAPFTKVNLTANGGDVIVDSLVIQRGGLGQDAAFSSVAVILDTLGGDQLGNNVSFNATHQTTLNDDLTIPNGTTRSIYLVGNMGTIGATYAGEVPALTLYSMTLKGDATLNATLPITGNYMTLNGTITIGTATIANGSNNPSASTQNVGTENYIVSSVKVTAGAVEAVTVEKLVFTQDGSAGASDVKNIDLVNGNTGEVLATIEQPTSGTLTFTPNLTLGKGKNVNFDLRLDIANGSARTISYDIDEQTDIAVKGGTYGYYITPTYGTTARPYYNAPDTTVGNGSLRIEAMSITPTNIAENKTDVLLGKFKFVAKGEEVKITSIGWNTKITIGATASATTSDITNLTVYDANGVVLAGPMDPTYDASASSGVNTYGAATTTDTIVIPAGDNIYTVRGDLSGDFTADDTVQISILPRTVTARGMVTNNSITPTPASPVSSTVLTVKSSSLAMTVSSVPAAQTVVSGTPDYTFANFVFNATASGSDIKVTQILVTVHTDATTYPSLISDIDLFDGTTEILWDSYSESSNWNSTANNEATTTITLKSGELVIPAGTTKTIKVVADIGTGITSGDISLGLMQDSVVATDEDGNTVSETTTSGDGSAMTLSAGGTLNLDVLSDPVAALVVAGSEGVTVGKFSIQAKYEDININYLGVTASNENKKVSMAGDYQDITSLSLYKEGSTSVLGTVAVSAANATITPSTTLTIPKGETETYILKANFSVLGDTSAAASGETVTLTITGLDVTGASAGSSSVTVNGLDTNFSDFTLYKSVPTVTKLAFSGADVITSNGVVSLYKFKVTADAAGPIGLFKFTFGISTTTVNLCNTLTDLKDTTGYYLYMSDSEGTLGDIVSKGGVAEIGKDIYSTPGATIIEGQGSGRNEVLLETWFDKNDDQASSTDELLIITGGATKYFTLRGTISTGHDVTGDNEFISTVMAGDADFAINDTVRDADGVDGLDQNDFIWSDLNADRYTTSSATSTNMFFNGFRIPGMDNTSSTAQTISD